MRLNGGSQHKIPFLPMVNVKGAPMGTEKYTKDIRVSAPITFVGNGIVRKGQFGAYGDLDVAGTVVMFSYDFPDSVHADLEKQVSLEERIRDAVARKAVAIVMFSMSKEYPFPFYKEPDPAKVPEIPVIAINRRAASIILASGGLEPDALFSEWQSKGTFHAQRLISTLDLKIEGKFDHIETDNFSFYFQKGRIPSGQAAALAAVNERSVKFILELFKDEKLKWHKAFSAYFPDYDSKLFYVRHWGKGLSGEAGTFMVFDGTAPDFGLAAHENTHALLNQNWNGSSSFLEEGMGRYVEALATDKDKNHRQTLAFLNEAKLFPLEQMAGIEIGSDPRTGVAYPAAGSFMQYLGRAYPLSKIKHAWQMEGQEKSATSADTWTTVFGKPLRQLEREWLYWLAEQYKFDRAQVDAYLAKNANAEASK